MNVTEGAKPVLELLVHRHRLSARLEPCPRPLSPSAPPPPPPRTLPALPRPCGRESNRRSLLRGYAAAPDRLSYRKFPPGRLLERSRGSGGLRHRRRCHPPALENRSAFHPPSGMRAPWPRGSSGAKSREGSTFRKDSSRTILHRAFPPRE